jgi:hypothetical protein
MTRLRRLGYAALSACSGWLAAQFLCLPVNLLTAVRNSEGQTKLFVQTLLYGLLAWGAWTFLLAFVTWVVVVLPLVMTIRPCLLVRMRYLVLSLAALTALGLAATRPSLFRDATSISLYHKFAQMIPYGLFALAFTLVTAWMYILLSKRRLDRAELEVNQRG